MSTVMVWVVLNDCCGHAGLYGVYATEELATAAMERFKIKEPSATFDVESRTVEQA